ncbi:hypothetical protein [Streptomyces manipurensis]|uniref:hypothetical protein n=1 Tax=Streptomyces manipurensis TaxID=1077945 RepID=UPI003C701B16
MSSPQAHPTPPTPPTPPVPAAFRIRGPRLEAEETAAVLAVLTALLQSAPAPPPATPPPPPATWDRTPPARGPRPGSWRPH